MASTLLHVFISLSTAYVNEIAMRINTYHNILSGIDTNFGQVNQEIGCLTRS